jgi:hypothetical protein
MHEGTYIIQARLPLALCRRHSKRSCSGDNTTNSLFWNGQDDLPGVLTKPTRDTPRAWPDRRSDSRHGR